MIPENIWNLFQDSINSLRNLHDTDDRPLLAHYTSLEVVENIIKYNELWFSNPLFMNDLQEMRFGLLEGRSAIERLRDDEEFAAGVGRDRLGAFLDTFGIQFDQYDKEHALNVFVFCLSEHDPDDNDGALSMWRGYGRNGDGAALVFRTDFVEVDDQSPLLVCKVKYSRPLERIEWLSRVAQKAKQALLNEHISNDDISNIAIAAFQIILVYSLSCKHRGFIEENEWRVIYLPDRDAAQLFSPYFNYIIGKRGVEPKLRFPIKPLSNSQATWNLDSILDRIILGPQLSTALAVKAVERMLDTLDKAHFKKLLSASDIPFRARD